MAGDNKKDKNEDLSMKRGTKIDRKTVIKMRNKTK